jgi:hypothetical protein
MLYGEQPENMRIGVEGVLAASSFSSASKYASTCSPNRSLAPSHTDGAVLLHSTTTPTAASVNWTALSQTGRETLRTIALPISLGYSQAEVASSLGVSKQQISEDLAALCWEIKYQCP